MTKNANLSALQLIGGDPFEALLDAHLEAWTRSESEVCASGATRLSAATVHSIRNSRVLAAPIPKSFGGQGADLLSTARAVRRVARTAPSTALCLSMPLGNAANTSVGLRLDGALAAATFVYPGAIVGVNARHWSTLLMASVFAGIGDGALAAAVECAPHGSEWARSTLADCALSLDAASGFIDAVAREEFTPCTPQYAERCRRAKSFAARTAVEVSARCMMIAGGRAYRADHPLARALLDAAAGPLLRPPLPQAMDSLAAQLLD